MQACSARQRHWGDCCCLLLLSGPQDGQLKVHIRGCCMWPHQRRGACTARWRNLSDCCCLLLLSGPQNRQFKMHIRGCCMWLHQRRGACTERWQHFGDFCCLLLLFGPQSRQLKMHTRGCCMWPRHAERLESLPESAQAMWRLILSCAGSRYKCHKYVAQFGRPSTSTASRLPLPQLPR